MLNMPPPLPDQTEQDLQLLKQVAAGHLLFGQYAKALRVLHLAQRLSPTDPGTQELMITAAFRSGALDYVVTACAQMETEGRVLPDELRQYRRVAVLATRNQEARETTRVPAA